MVDLVYGRGITTLMRELPSYLSFFRKYLEIKFFHKRRVLYGSADIINICNLHCTHCYWWLNREDDTNELTPEDWRQVIKNTFKKQRVLGVTLVGGEPTMRPDIIEVFCKELPGIVCVVTNGNFPLKRYEQLYFYWVSLDGTQKVHDTIRGEGSYTKTKKNILEYIKGPPRNGKPVWKDIWLTMTINSVNYSTAIDLAEEWRGTINKIGFQFHTPFMKGDPLWLQFGDLRSEIVDQLIALRRKYPKFVVNTEKQLQLMKGNWGGTGTIPLQCPSWAILSLDHKGRIKQPCCIGSADAKALKPICEDCGLGCYSVLVANGIVGT